MKIDVVVSKGQKINFMEPKFYDAGIYKHGL